MRRGVQIAAVTLLGITTLVACSGESPQAADSPPSSASVTSDTPDATATRPLESPTPPTEAPPPLPVEAQAADVDGAAAFIRHYFDVVNYAYRTGDVAPLDAISAEGCASCLNVLDRAVQGNASGGGMRDGAISIGDLAVAAGDPATGLEATGSLSQRAGTWVNDSGDIVEDVEEVDGYFLGVIVVYDSYWSVLEWGNGNELA